MKNLYLKQESNAKRRGKQHKEESNSEKENRTMQRRVKQHHEKNITTRGGKPENMGKKVEQCEEENLLAQGEQSNTRRKTEQCEEKTRAT